MKLLRAVLCFTTLSPALTLVSCMTHTELVYGPFERSLSDQAELLISTYPAGFPKETSHTPYVSSTLKSANVLYFQVNVREPGRKTGPNTKVDSITIHSFAYQLGDRKWVTLIENHSKGFWMQGNPNYDAGSDPVPYLEDGKVTIRIDFSVDGKRQQIEGVMEAGKKTTTLPLFLRKAGV